MAPESSNAPSDSPGELDSAKPPSPIIRCYHDIAKAPAPSQLPRIAASIRNRANGPGDEPFAEPVVREPLYGGMHILHPVEFSDGVKWLLKVAANDDFPGYWNEVCERAIVSEALTMRLIKRSTTIPIPEVLDFCSTPDNPLKCPNIMISFVDGISLKELWYSQDPGVSDDEKERRGHRALRELAGAMAQLCRFPFDKSGQPLFGDQEELVGIGSGRDCNRLDRVLPLYFRTNPRSDTAEWFLALQKRPASEPYDKAVEKLLRLFIDWLAEWDVHNGHFVLTHPDFQLDNCIVSPEGKLLAIIDWDGVAACPKVFANQRYPWWLTRDWAPAYRLREGPDGEPLLGAREDMPRALERYRKVYREALNGATSAEPDRRMKGAAMVTHNLSLIALGRRDCPEGTLERIVGEMKRFLPVAVPGVPGDSDLYSELCDLLIKDEEMPSELRGALHVGFCSLLEEEPS